MTHPPHGHQPPPASKPTRLRLHVGPTGLGTVELNGEDISAAVNGVELRSRVGRTTEATLHPDRPWSDTDRELVALALAGRVRYSQHGQQCPVWTRADCDSVDLATQPVVTHDPDCWMVHNLCWAARIRRTLTGDPK